MPKDFTSRWHPAVKLLLLFLIVGAAFQMCLFGTIFSPVELKNLLLLFFGWALFIADVTARMETYWPALIMGLCSLVIAFMAIHVLGRWLDGATSKSSAAPEAGEPAWPAPAPAPARRLSARPSACSLAFIMLACIAGAAVVGLVTHSAWFGRDIAEGKAFHRDPSTIQRRAPIAPVE